MAIFNSQLKGFNPWNLRILWELVIPIFNVKFQVLGTIPVYLQRLPNYCHCPGLCTDDQGSSWHQNMNNSNSTSLVARGWRPEVRAKGCPSCEGKEERGSSQGKCTSFSGDSTSLSSTSMSFLILCAKGERFEGEGTLGEAGKGRFLALWVLAGKAATVCRRCTEASAACRREPFWGGGREGAAKVAGCWTELLHYLDEDFFFLVTASDPTGKQPLGKKRRMGR